MSWSGFPEDERDLAPHLVTFVALAPEQGQWCPCDHCSLSFPLEPSLSDSSMGGSLYQIKDTNLTIPSIPFLTAQGKMPLLHFMQINFLQPNL